MIFLKPIGRHDGDVSLLIYYLDLLRHTLHYNDEPRRGYGVNFRWH